MAKLLYIEASPKLEKSVSSRIAHAFLESYRAANPSDEIDRLNVFADRLSDFDRQGAEQKMAHIASLMKSGKELDAAGQWAGVVKEIDRLKAADKVVVSSPMWNFSIPYRLKHYIDLICQPALTFAVNRKGEYVGLIKGKPILFILSSGSGYAPRFPREDDGAKTDFQRAYLEHIARFIGFEDIRVIKAEPMDAVPAQEAASILETKVAEAKALGAVF